MSLIIALIIGILSIILPGFFLSLALLKKTGMPMFEIAVIGFIFGLIFPSTMIWLESYLIPFFPIFTFSNALYNVNVIILTIIGIALSVQQGAISKDSFSSVMSGFSQNKFSIRQESERDYKKRLTNIRQTLSELNTDVKIVREHEREEEDLLRMHQSELSALKGVGTEERKKIEESHLEQEKRLYEEHESEERRLIQGPQAETKEKSTTMSYVWMLLLVLMLISFATRMLSIGSAPTYFEFDPYFDMVSTQYILTYGYQLLWDHAAWPSLAGGTIHRLQPLVPYLEAYWYNLAGANPSSTTVDTTLLSLVSSYYPPIAAALLVFVVFMFLYHEYGVYEGLLGAALATVMPILITTFVAGEQLVEPWGIFALFFFYAAYLLAVNHPEEPRYAILAGIAFASNFLGAHYYTLTAGILAGYIVLQGAVNVLRGKDSKSFYKMNAIVIAVIVIFFIFYNAYGATLTERTPSILGLPVIIGFPIFGLIGVFISDIAVNRLSQNKAITKMNTGETAKYVFLGVLLIFLIGLTVLAYDVVGFIIFVAPLIMLEVVAYPVIAMHLLKTKGSLPNSSLRLMLGIEALMVLSVLAMIFIFLTPLGNPVFSYIQLSKKFTTASSPLFMTVQEYAPTGLTYDYGNVGGFGIIGASIAGIPIIVLGVLILFTILVLLAIYNRDSKSSILAYAAVWSVAVAGMIEVKYLPHFGVAYIIALGAIFGELAIYFANKHEDNMKKYLFYFGIFIVIVAAFPSVFSIISAASNPNCNDMGNNQLGLVLYCNTIQLQNPGWLPALTWMKTNVGPYAPRILSWWDYGDWINWFGNSNAVIRGDNSVASEDYDVAAHYVLTSQEGVNTSDLQTFMDSVQAKYILFDNQLVPKWGALDFLACVDINQTSLQQATAAGGPGSSACEAEHDPAYILIPITQNINNYCTLPGNSTDVTTLHGIVIVGQSEVNQSYCVPVAAINSGETTYLLNNNGTKSNVLLTSTYFGGEITSGDTTYISFMLLYAPTGPNDTINDAPSEFYNSTYYKGFFLGKLPGFTMVYPSNFTSGINFVNSTHMVVIFQSDNYTGTPVNVTAKPSYVNNNYTMPG